MPSRSSQALLRDRPGGRGSAVSGAKRFAVGCDLRYQAQEPCTVLLNIAVGASGRQFMLDEKLDVSPDRSIAGWTEGTTGNRFGRMTLGPGQGRVAYRAEVVVEQRPRPSDTECGIADLPFETLHYLRPSRYCPIEEIAEFAHRTFGEGPVSRERAAAVCEWVRTNLVYLAGSSDTRTTAIHTLANRAGVCRDFAHLGIALLRALDIPARYVTAYAWGLEFPDFHAMVEAFCGDGWELFDPSGQADPADTVRIGIGYDAAEIPFATWFGPGQFSELEIRCEAMDDPPEAA